MIIPFNISTIFTVVWSNIAESYRPIHQGLSKFQPLVAARSPTHADTQRQSFLKPLIECNPKRPNLSRLLAWRTTSSTHALANWDLACHMPFITTILLARTHRYWPLLDRTLVSLQSLTHFLQLIRESTKKRCSDWRLSSLIHSWYGVSVAAICLTVVFGYVPKGENRWKQNICTANILITSPHFRLVRRALLFCCSIKLGSMSIGKAPSWKVDSY